MHVELPWAQGKRMSAYLKDPTVKRYGLIAKATSGRRRLLTSNRTRLHLRSTVPDNTSVFLVPAGA